MIIDEMCLDCGCYDSDFGCIFPSAGKWYACPLEPEVELEDFLTEEELKGHASSRGEEKL